VTIPDEEICTLDEPEVIKYDTEPPKLPVVESVVEKLDEVAGIVEPDVVTVVSVDDVTIKLNEKVPVSPSGSVVVPLTL
jgi:hypothetical protein